MTSPTQELLKPKRRGLFVAGEWISGYGPLLKSNDPYNGALLYDAQMASPADVTRAVNAARTSGYNWMTTDFEERVALVHAFKEELIKAEEELALTIAKEIGKPLWEAKTEVAAAIGKIDISIKSYHERCKEIHIDKGSLSWQAKHRPHGVVAVLGPFNFPLHLPNGHIVPALLAGNSVVFKPSDQSPLTGELYVKCWERAGIPPGVLNLLQGRGEIGKALAAHDDVRGIFFTGSVEVGKALLKANADRLERILALELGGNNPLVISNVADLDAAVYQTILSAFITTGQRCTAARRLVVVRSKENQKFLEKLVAATRELQTGHYSDSPEPFMGPLISEPAVVKAVTLQAALEGFGGVPLVKMEQLEDKTGRITPGIMDVTKVERRKDQELFAPFLQVIWVDDFFEAIQVASDTKYGLSAGLFSDSEKEFEIFYSRVRAGIVNWNQPTTGASSALPFGGVGLSGNHRPSAFYAADYCAFPVASTLSESLSRPENPLPGYPHG